MNHPKNVPRNIEITTHLVARKQITYVDHFSPVPRALETKSIERKNDDDCLMVAHRFFFFLH